MKPSNSSRRTMTTTTGAAAMAATIMMSGRARLVGGARHYLAGSALLLLVIMTLGAGPSGRQLLVSASGASNLVSVGTASKGTGAGGHQSASAAAAAAAAAATTTTTITATEDNLALPSNQQQQQQQQRSLVPVMSRRDLVAGGEQRRERRRSQQHLAGAVPGPISPRDDEDAYDLSMGQSNIANAKIQLGAHDMTPAAAGHYGKSHGKYYMYAEVPKKGAYKMGFKRGNHKHMISRKEEAHKGHVHGYFKWHDKKGKGSHKWELKHYDKKSKHY